MFLRWSNTYRLGKKTHERTDRVNILRSVEIHELIHRLPGMCVRFCEGSAMIVVFTCLNSGEHARQHESVGGGCDYFGISNEHTDWYFSLQNDTIKCRTNTATI